MYPVAMVAGSDISLVSSYVSQSILDNPLSTEVQVKTELNNLRSRLANTKAMVTTYTYKSSVGVTSETDPAGRTTSYEYDNNGKLILVRDQDGKIVKKICYNYAGQPEGCFAGTYYSKPLTGIFYKTNCPDGSISIPASYTYSLPNGAYSSVNSQAAADAAAQSALSANGQALANQMTCKYPNAAITVNLTPVCNTGYYGALYSYTVPAGTFLSTISIADANQMATDKINSTGQAEANQLGTCFKSNTAFARLSRENNYNLNENRYEDIVIRFFQDVACTIPVSVSGLTINIEQQVYSGNSNSYTYTFPSFTISGNSAILLANQLIIGTENNDIVEKYFYLRSGTGYNIAN